MASEHEICVVLDDVQTAILDAREKLPANWNDAKNTRNDWIAYALAYIGRASEKVLRNDDDPREMLVKAAGLLVEAAARE